MEITRQKAIDTLTRIINKTDFFDKNFMSIVKSIKELVFLSMYILH
jgi:hypothetical protein